MITNTRILLIAGLLAIAGPSWAVVACNGDSNTQSNWQGYPRGTADGWCERAGELLGEAVINRGVGGSGIVDNGFYLREVPLWGGYYIEAQAAGSDPFLPWATGAPPSFLGQPVYSPLGVPNVFILAFGTNDIRYGYTPRQIISYIKKYRQRVAAAGGIAYVATCPPQFNADGSPSVFDEEIRDLNRKIRGNWPQRYVEFYEGFTFADFQADGIHLSADGQAKRAVAAASALGY